MTIARPLKWPWLCHALRLVSVWLCFAAPVSVLGLSPDDAHRMGELSKKMEELAARMQACGNDTRCFNRVAAEMEAVSAQYANMLKQFPRAPDWPAYESQVPSCAHFFRPGWSCIPVTATVETSLDRLDHDFWCDPPGFLPCNRRDYIGHEYHYADRAEGKGILAYTADLKGFHLLVIGNQGGTTLTRVAGKRRTVGAGPSGRGFVMQETDDPAGPMSVAQPFGLQVMHPSPVPGLSNFRYTGPVVLAEGGAGSPIYVPASPAEGQDPPPMLTSQAVAQALAQRHYETTLQWRWAFEPGEQSRDDTRIRIRLSIDAAAQDKPGVFSVTPPGAIKVTGPDKQCRFAPLTHAYKLGNSGQAPVAFSVENDVAWLSIDPSEGVLQPGSTLTATVTLDDKALGNLDQGLHKATIRFRDRSAGTALSRVVEVSIDKEQNWHVRLTGYEIDEMDPYWKVTTKLRGAVRFDYQLSGQFTVRRDADCHWQYKSGTVERAAVRLSDLHEPRTSWEVPPFKCRNCDDLERLQGKLLSGYTRGDNVHLSWSTLQPAASVMARVAIPCTPQPACSQMKPREFISETFFHRVNHLALPLADGIVLEDSVVSPQQLRWVRYRYELTKK